MLSNAPTADLVHAYILAKAAAEKADAAVAAARDAILATGLEVVAGHTADVVVTLAERTALDTAAAKKQLGDAAPLKTSVVTTLRIKVRVDA
jgi:hypothetical protein